MSLGVTTRSFSSAPARAAPEAPGGDHRRHAHRQNRDVQAGLVQSNPAVAHARPGGDARVRELDRAAQPAHLAAGQGVHGDNQAGAEFFAHGGDGLRRLHARCGEDACLQRRHRAEAAEFLGEVPPEWRVTKMFRMVRGPRASGVMTSLPRPTTSTASSGASGGSSARRLSARTPALSPRALGRRRSMGRGSSVT